MAGLNDLSGHFQPLWFYDSLYCDTHFSYKCSLLIYQHLHICLCQGWGSNHLHTLSGSILNPRNHKVAFVSWLFWEAPWRSTLFPWSQNLFSLSTLFSPSPRLPMSWGTLWKYSLLNIPGPVDLTYTWPSLAESWKSKDFAATFSRKLQRIPKILAEIVVWHFPRAGAHWGECALISVCVVRSDMSQLCSCIPLAQAFSCPIRRYFSSNEKRKNLYPFCDSFEITSSCIFEAQTSQMGLIVSWWQCTPARVYDFQAVSNLLLCCHIPCKWPQWCIHEILALWYSCNSIWSAGDASHAGMTWQEKSLSWTNSFDYTEISIFKQNFNRIYLKSSYDFIVQSPREHN